MIRLQDRSSIRGYIHLWVDHGGGMMTESFRDRGCWRCGREDVEVVSRE